MQNLQRESPTVAKPESLSNRPAAKQTPLQSPFKDAVTSAMNQPLPVVAAAVAIPARPASSPRMNQAYSAATLPAAAAQSLSFTDLPHDRESSPALQSQASSLSAKQPEHKSIEDLCFEAASLGISESGSKMSVAETDFECNSSASENSSVQALEVSLLTAA